MHRREFVAFGAGAVGLTLLGRRTSAHQADDPRPTTIGIKLAGVFVEDQAKALEFYTTILGLVKKNDLPVGQFRWLTVVSPLAPDGTELLLEPNANPAARTFQQAIFAQGIPATALPVGDLQYEYDRLKALGVVFRTEPTDIGTATIAMFDDTCGNLIQLYQES